MHSLLDQLRDPDRNVRAGAALSLGKLANPATAGVLVEALATEPDFFNREYLTWSIVRMADAATPLLIAMLKDIRAQARHGAAHTLGKIANPSAAPALIAALQDDDTTVVSKAAFSLGAINAVEAAPALTNLLGRENRELQSTLVSVFERLGADALPSVREALTHVDARVREHAADVLGAVADAGSVSALARTLGDAVPQVRFAAVHALSNIGGDAAVEAIRSMHNDADASVRALAAKVLSRATV